MKSIRLVSLTLEHFKGLHAFTLTPDGHNVTVRGDNAAGKTTLMDAFLWLLFGKDSAGSTTFALKTVGPDGEPIHNLDHAVTAVLDVDGTRVELRRVFREKWTKRRGSAHGELTGHTTEYYVDGVPLPEKDWKPRVEAIVPEETFRLLTSPGYFPGLHWQKRREILASLIDGVTDADVIASSEALARLPEILGTRTMDEHRRVVAARKKLVAARLTEIPARIDELNRQVAGVANQDRGEIEAEVARLDAAIAEAKAGAGSADLMRQRTEARKALADLQERRENERRTALQTLRDEVATLTGDAAQADREVRSARGEVERLTREQAGTLDKRTALRERFRREDAAEIEHCDGIPIADTCPLTGRPLPATCASEVEGKIEAERRAATERFNQTKADRLKEINADGQRLNATLADLAERLVAAQAALEKATEAQAGLPDRLADARDRLRAAETAPHALDEKIAGLRAEVDRLTIAAEDATPDTRTMEAERKTGQALLGALDAAKAAQARIAELSEEEKRLAAEAEDLEAQVFLMERFTVARAELVEARVNGLFEVARFRLFRPQLNDGIAEVCDILANGVPYGAGLNNGAEINVGLDIIRTLSRHYGVTAPIFVDNAEAVVRLMNPGSQMVRLVVDGTAKQLTVSGDDNA